MRTILAGASRAVLLGLLCLSAQAATTFDITTNSMARAVDGVCTLQEVLEVLRTSTTVNECVDANAPYTVNLIAGTFTVTVPTDTSTGNSAARVNFDTTINGNGATLAGGAANLRAFLVDAPLTLRDLSITGFAGATIGTVFVLLDGQVNLERVVVTGNGTAGRPVIAVQCNPCETNLHQSAIYANTGSVAVSLTGGSTANIANSTLEGSTLSFMGVGGVTINLSNATVQNGITGTGNGSLFRLNRSIFNGPCTLSAGWNLVYLGTAAFGDDCGGGGGEGTQPLDDNGGATRTYATTRGVSGAVDATPAACPYISDGTNPLFANGAANTVDQRGEPRDALCDSGAYETSFPATLPNGIVGVPYATTPVAGANTFPTSGTLPSGLNFVVGGSLQGAPTAAGNFTFDLQANRSGSRKDFAHYTVTITAAPPPDTTLTATPPNPSSSASPSFSFTGVDNGAGILGFQCRVDPDPFIPCTSPFVVGALSDGSHTFRVRALDNAGFLDPTPASFTWVTDVTAPDTGFIVVPPALSNLANPLFEFLGSDAGGSGVTGFQCRLDGGSFSPCSSPLTLTAPGDGPHTLEVRAVDAAGNVDLSPAIYVWTIDATASPPVITSPAAAATVLPNPPLSGTGEAGALVTVREGVATVCTATVTGGGTWTCATSLGNGAHTIDAIQLDTAGNTSTASASVTFTVATPVNSYTATSATGTGMITASFIGGGPFCTYGVSQFIPVTGNPASPPAGSAPQSLVFPHGLFDFTATGCTPGSTITMSITYPTALQPGTLYYKYGPTPSDPAPHWYVLPATIAGNTATFTIVDGGLGDDDLAANGTIVDQGGPGFPIGGPGSGIPTLSEWGMLLLIAGMLVMVGRRARKERAAD